MPTVADTLSGFDASSWHGVFAPTGTPRPIIDKLAAELRRIFELPDVKAKFFEIGAVPSPMTPEPFPAFVEDERKKWQEVVRTANVQAP